MILFAPLWLGLLAFVALLLIAKLPRFCCERRRAVRYLPYAGLAYYGLAVPLLLAGLGLAWRDILIGTALFALNGDWLLPDPFTFLWSPRRRRAVKRAIEHLEAGDGPQPIYGMVRVVGAEAERVVVSVMIGDTKPPARRFLAVADATANVAELDFVYASEKHGVQAWF
ncbi:MAG: hypothetical protein JNM56_39930 [Planctomycetia bacterium]|nr:hypothetical protein [Planctomycetia bacterium]